MSLHSSCIFSDVISRMSSQFLNRKTKGFSKKIYIDINLYTLYFERQKEKREMNRHREISHLVVHIPNAHNSQDWSRLKPRVSNCI